jgi:hypothetical protein
LSLVSSNEEKRERARARREQTRAEADRERRVQSDVKRLALYDDPDFADFILWLREEIGEAELTLDQLLELGAVVGEMTMQRAWEAEAADTD